MAKLIKDKTSTIFSVAAPLGFQTHSDKIANAGISTAPIITTAFMISFRFRSNRVI
jgi:hypothetical protein